VDAMDTKVIINNEEIVSSFINSFKEETISILSHQIINKYFYKQTTWSCLLIQKILKNSLNGIGITDDINMIIDYEINCLNNKSIDIGIKQIASNNIVISIEHENKCLDIMNAKGNLKKNNEFIKLLDVYDSQKEIKSEMMVLITYPGNLNATATKKWINKFLTIMSDKIDENNINSPFVLILGSPPVDLSQDHNSKDDYIEWSVIIKPKSGLGLTQDTKQKWRSP
jgi:hypothetical protein